MTTRRTPIKSTEALTAYAILFQVGFVKRPKLQALMGRELSRDISDDQFEAAMTEIGSRIIRTRGMGGGIRLF